MKETVIKITMNREKDWINPTVSEVVREFTYEEMNALREALCSMIAESEKLWQEG